MASRHQLHHKLHHSHLAEFTAFCRLFGWRREAIVGEHEVLRMRHPFERTPLLVHWRNGKREQVIIAGHSERLARAFFLQRTRTTA